MKRGDLVKVTYRGHTSGELCICYDPNPISLNTSNPEHERFKAVQMLKMDGTIRAYAINRWIFEVINESG